MIPLLGGETLKEQRAYQDRKMWEEMLRVCRDEIAFLRREIERLKAQIEAMEKK